MASPAAAAPAGSVDPTFGSGGQAQAALPGGVTVLRGGLFQQADGRIVAAGTFNAPNNTTGASGTAVMTRFTRSGVPDAGYGEDGWLKDDRFETTGRPVAGPADTVLLPGGRIDQDGTAGAYVARYTADGDRDRRFGDDGALRLDLPKEGFWWARFIAVDRDGSIFVGFQGQRNLTTDSRMRYGIAHLDGSGKAAKGFGDGGYVLSDEDVDSDTAGPLAVMPDGGVAIATTAGDYGPLPNGYGLTSNVIVVRYDKHGKLDSGFGTGGRAKTEIGGDAADLVSYRDGGLAVVAPTTQPPAPRRIVLERFDKNGVPVGDFAQSGVFQMRVGGTTSPAALALQQDGKLVIAGGFFQPAADPTANSDQNGWTLVRVKPTGKLDGSFGDKGVVTSARGRSFTQATDVEIQDDGSIVAAGTASSCDASASFTLVRFTGEADDRPDPGPLVTTCPGDLPADTSAIEVEIACPLLEETCAGDVAVEVPAAPKRSIKTGKARFKLRGNSRTSAKVKLSGAVRNYVKKHRRFRAIAVIAARDSDGHRRVVKRRVNVAR